jgi:hypothetical protein
MEEDRKTAGRREEQLSRKKNDISYCNILTDWIFLTRIF